MSIVIVRVVGEEEDQLCNIVFDTDDEICRSDLINKIERRTCIPPPFQEITFRGEKLSTAEHPIQSIKFGEEIVVSHAHLDLWKSYCAKIDIIQNNVHNVSIADRQAFTDSVNSIDQILSKSGFYQAYLSFLVYRDCNHWKIRKYFECDISTIVAASRKHFAAQNILKGGSENDFHFEFDAFDPDSSHSGIVVSVRLGAEKETSKWQVKTLHNRHRHRVDIIPAPDPNIRELFCYKLLGLIGVGPEAQFITLSKELGSKMSVYIGTRWRDDFVRQFEIGNHESAISSEALVQLHLLQVLLNVEDLHEWNCGAWEGSNTAAIVDFCMGIERKYARRFFELRYNTRLAWDGRAKELFESTSKMERIDIAKKWLKEWDFLAKIDEAESAMAQVKAVLEEEFTAKFRRCNIEEDDKDYANEITNELQDYIKLVKSKVEELSE